MKIKTNVLVLIAVLSAAALSSGLSGNGLQTDPAKEFSS